MKLNFRSHALAAAAAAGLAACGGGGSPTSLVPETPAPSPTPGNPAPAPSPGNPDPDEPPAPTPDDPVPPPRNLADYGLYAAPGINRLPIYQIRASNSELAEMVALVEYVGLDDPERHPQLVSKVACHSFVLACDNPADPTAGDAPFSLVTPTIDPSIDRSDKLTDNLLDELPSTTKLVSLSVEPVFYTLAERFGAGLQFALVQSAGNSGEEELFRWAREEDQEDRIGIVRDPASGTYVSLDGQPIPSDYIFMIERIREAVESDKVLYVSGYEYVVDSSGSRVVRHPSATDCLGVEDACLYAPFQYRLPRGSREQVRLVQGTSGGAPNVAMALASVLAFFPETAGEDLIRLAKSCADHEPELSGLGIANFNCMTELDSRGEWRLVSDTQFAELISPADMNGLAFPGTATISGEFATNRVGARPVRLAMSRPGTFGVGSFSAGIRKPPAEGVSGFYPVAAVGEESGSIGGGYVAAEGFFAAAAVGRDNGFFGLGLKNDYGPSSTVDLSVGHRNLFVRASRQMNDGGGVFVDEAEGSAVGVTASGKREIAPGLSMSAALHADRFVGGSAATAFGPVRIGRSPWNRSAELALRKEIGAGAAYSLGGTFSRRSDGTTAKQVRTEVGIRF